MTHPEPPDLHVGDIGTELILALVDEEGGPVDLTGYQTLTLIIERPDGTKLEKVAAPSGDPTAGLVAAYSSAGDLNQTGHYRLQAAAVLPAWTGKSQIRTFRVAPNL